MPCTNDFKRTSWSSGLEISRDEDVGVKDRRSILDIPDFMNNRSNLSQRKLAIPFSGHQPLAMGIDRRLGRRPSARSKSIHKLKDCSLFLRWKPTKLTDDRVAARGRRVSH